MNAIIITNFETYFERVKLLKEYYESKGYSTKVVSSNFKHINKEYYESSSNDYYLIDTLYYKKNLSIRRMKSHYNFAKEAFKYIEQQNVHLLHVLIPSNSLTKFASKYKSKNQNVKVIIDVIDLWPETMPIGNVKHLFPFSLWKNMRDKYIRNLDCIITECNLFKKALNINDKKVSTLLWSKDNSNLISKPVYKENELHLCYLGSINNIIDLDKIYEIVGKINNIIPVTVHIIAKGEKKEEFINRLCINSKNVIDYGSVYDENEKQIIFDQCQFGLNIMKNSVCVGLTMKSLDYLNAGLPLINNIKGDTEEFVNNFNCGYNIENIDVLLEHIKKEDFIKENKKMRSNSKKLFTKCLSKEVFLSNVDKLLKL